MADSFGLDALFRPRSVAVIGASSDPSKIGGRPIAYMKRGGFAKPLFPINPSGGEVQGLRAYAGLDAVPDAVDLAVVAVPAPLVPEAVESCVRKGVRAIVMLSAGFAEVDEAGRLHQEAVARRCAETGIRLVGPNSIGLFNAKEGLYATFATGLQSVLIPPGAVALVSQSGALGSYLYGLAQQRGLRFSHFAATGNEADVDVAACIQWFADDPDTRVICAYIEGCRDGARLRAALDLARVRRKPVIMLKVGRSETGAAAAASHTGALAGVDAVYDAVFAETGACRVRTVEEMLDLAHACSVSPLPTGNRLGVITVSGGVGVIIADAAAERGLVLPPLSAADRKKVRDVVPFASGMNPVDTTGQTVQDRTLFTRILGTLAEGGDYDSFVAFVSNVGASRAEFDKLGPSFRHLRERFPDRVFALCTRTIPEVREELEAMKFLVFEDPVRVTDAIAAMRGIAQSFDQPQDRAARAAARSIERPQGTLDEARAGAILADAGVPFAPTRTACTVGDAVEAARALGFPVVLKVLSPDIAHKSDAGGVEIGIRDEAALEAAWARMMQNVAVKAPGAAITGALVSPMLSGGVELVLGVNRDPVFGPVAMFGLGGVFVEIFRDVAFRVAPIGRDAALAMIARTRAYPLLTGARGRQPVDLGCVADALVCLSNFAWTNRAWVRSVEVNPFIALPDGGFAVDALIVPG